MTTPLPTQAWNDRIVTGILISSCGDLMLSNRGDLHTRNVWGRDDKELPWAQHTLGDMLATISCSGWTLTPRGANYILENEIFDRRDYRKLLRVIEEVALSRA